MNSLFQIVQNTNQSSFKTSALNVPKQCSIYDISYLDQRCNVLCALPSSVHSPCSIQDPVHSQQPLWCRFSTSPLRDSLFASAFRGGLRLRQGTFEGRHLALTHQSNWECRWLLGENLCSTASTSIAAICHSCWWRSTELGLGLCPVCGSHLLALGGGLQLHYRVLVLHTQTWGFVPLRASLDQVKTSLQI